MNCLIGEVKYLIYDKQSNAPRHIGKKNIFILVEFSYLNKMNTFIVLRTPERPVGIQWSKATANKNSYERVQCRHSRRFYKMFCHERK
jgi:hypothetical protein